MYKIPMPVVTELETEPQATPEERRIALIEKVRTRLLQNPDTLVSHRVKDPERIQLTLSFSPSEGVYVKISSWPDNLIADHKIVYKDPIHGTHTRGKMIEISAKQQTYLDWLGAGWLEGDEALTQAGNEIEDFLPTEQPLPQVA